VPLLEILRAVVTDPHFSLSVFPDQDLQRKVDGAAGRRQHYWSAAFRVAEDQQFGGRHVHSHLFRLPTVVDQGKESDSFRLQNILELFDCLVD
jgi:hypothetical protein